LCNDFLCCCLSLVFSLLICIHWSTIVGGWMTMSMYNQSIKLILFHHQWKATYFRQYPSPHPSHTTSPTLGSTSLHLSMLHFNLLSALAT
jgi:hypothetical protein